VTTAPEAKKRIRALIEAQGALSNVTVRYGKATREPQVAPEMVWLGSIEDGETGWESLGRQRMLEEYTIGVTAVKETTGDTDDAEYQTEQRAADLIAEVRKAIQADPLLEQGGPIALLKEGVTFESGSITTDPIKEPAGWLSIAQLRVRCVARVPNT
jgi:hypothetical protein